MQSVAVSALFLAVGIAIFIIMCMKGAGTIPSAIVGAFIIAFATNTGVFESMFNSFLSGAAGFLKIMLLNFAAGALFGGLLNATGCADRIGLFFAKKMGVHLTFISIYVLVLLLASAGVSPVLVVSFVSFGLLRQLNLPRYIGMVACMGSTLSAAFSPAGINLIICGYLGTSIYGAPLLTTICALANLVLLHVYVMWLVKKARAKGIGYDPMPNEANMKAREEGELPSLWISLLPVVFVIVWCFVMINAFQWRSAHAGVTGMLIASLFLYIALNKRIKGNKFVILDNSVKPVVYALVCSCSAVGFASVVQNTSCFQAIVNGVTSWDISMYAIAVIGTAIFAAICADANGGASAFLAIMGERMLASGANPAVLHRLVQISSGTLDTLPHSGSVVMFMTLFGYDHKAYKYCVISNIVIPAICSVLGIVLALVLY